MSRRPNPYAVENVPTTSNDPVRELLSRLTESIHRDQSQSIEFQTPSVTPKTTSRITPRATPRATPTALESLPNNVTNNNDTVTTTNRRSATTSVSRSSVFLNSVSRQPTAVQRSNTHQYTTGRNKFFPRITVQRGQKNKETNANFCAICDTPETECNPVNFKRLKHGNTGDFHKVCKRCSISVGQSNVELQNSLIIPKGNPRKRFFEEQGIQDREVLDAEINHFGVPLQLFHLFNRNPFLKELMDNYLKLAEDPNSQDKQNPNFLKTIKRISQAFNTDLKTIKEMYLKIATRQPTQSVDNDGTQVTEHRHSRAKRRREEPRNNEGEIIEISNESDSDTNYPEPSDSDPRFISPPPSPSLQLNNSPEQTTLGQTSHPLELPSIHRSDVPEMNETENLLNFTPLFTSTWQPSSSRPPSATCEDIGTPVTPTHLATPTVSFLNRQSSSSLLNEQPTLQNHQEPSSNNSSQLASQSIFQRSSTSYARSVSENQVRQPNRSSYYYMNT